MTNYNPWLVDSLDAFSFLCCPECVYRSQESNSFQAHALQNHPQSIALFCSSSTSTEIKDEPESSTSDPQDSIKLQYNEDDFKDDIKLDQYSEPEDIGSEPEEDEDYEYQDKKPKRTHKKATTSKKYECTFCKEEFAKRCDMRLHMRTAHTNVQCDECDKKFENPAKLTKHKYLKHKEIECKECNKSYSPAVFTRHMKTVHVSKDNRTFMCDLCPFKSHAQRYLSEHKTNFHGNKVTPTTCLKTEKVKKETFEEDVICPECGKSVKAKTFVVHYRKAHGCLPPGYKDGKRFICDQCSVEYASMQSLKKHTENVHGEGSTDHPKEYRCQQCSQDFTGFHYLLIHFRHVHKDLPPEYKDQPQFICDQCPDIFLTEAHLKGHISRKHTKKSNTEQSTNTANKHVRKQCPNCEKTFGGYNALREHILVKHENNTPHQCEQCPRKFGLSHTLRVHQKYVHTKVRCDVCNEEVCNSFVLKRHKATVHGIVPTNSIKCLLCPMFFHTKKSLQNHVDKKHS